MYHINRRYFIFIFVLAFGILFLLCTNATQDCNALDNSLLGGPAWYSPIRTTAQADDIVASPTGRFGYLSDTASPYLSSRYSGYASMSTSPWTTRYPSAFGIPPIGGNAHALSTPSAYNMAGLLPSYLSAAQGSGAQISYMSPTAFMVNNPVNSFNQNLPSNFTPSTVFYPEPYNSILTMPHSGGFTSYAVLNRLFTFPGSYTPNPSSIALFDYTTIGYDRSPELGGVFTSPTR